MNVKMDSANKTDQAARFCKRSRGKLNLRACSVAGASGVEKDQEHVSSSKKRIANLSNESTGNKGWTARPERKTALPTIFIPATDTKR